MVTRGGGVYSLFKYRPLCQLGTAKFRPERGVCRGAGEYTSQRRSRSDVMPKRTIKRLVATCALTLYVAAKLTVTQKITTNTLPQNIRFSGSEYGGWWYNAAGLPAHPIVYSFGLGEDTSWDEAMLRLGARVYGFDPTPRASVYVQSRDELRQARGSFVYTKEGLAVEKGTVRFTMPKNPSHVSLRKGVFSKIGDTLELQVDTLDDFMKRNGHKSIDILKIDIEGAEYEVLEDLSRRKNFPFTQLLVEFHQRFEGIGEERHQKVLNELLHNGFVILKSTTSHEISFQKVL